MPTTKLHFGPAMPPVLWLVWIKVCHFLILYALASRLNAILDLDHLLISLICYGCKHLWLPGNCWSLVCHRSFCVHVISFHRHIFTSILTWCSSLTSPVLQGIFYAGSAVAVERIFSGRCDTISLCHASLNLEAIWTLMLVKQWLRIAPTLKKEMLFWESIR